MKGVGDHAVVSPRTVIDPWDDEWFIGDFCLVTVPRLVLMGKCHVNAGTKIVGREAVTIGRGSVVSYDCLLLTSSDTPSPEEWEHNDFALEECRRIRSAPIRIGDRCFIGAKSILMPGVSLPDRTVVPAGSYVVMDGSQVRIHNANYVIWRDRGMDRVMDG